MINKSDNESCPEGYVLPAGQNSSPRMKFNSQTKPLTTFSLLLTTCHIAQIHTFRLVAQIYLILSSRESVKDEIWFDEKPNFVSLFGNKSLSLYHNSKQNGH